MFLELTDLFRKKQARVVRYGVDTAVTNNTTGYGTLRVPKWKLWFVLQGSIFNGDDVQRSCYVQVLNDDGRVIGDAIDYFAPTNLGATTRYGMPKLANAANRASDQGFPLILSERMGLYATYTAGGASAGGTCSFEVLVVEVDVQP